MRMIVAGGIQKVEQVQLMFVSNDLLFGMKNRILWNSNRLCDGRSQLCNGNPPDFLASFLEAKSVF